MQSFFLDATRLADCCSSLPSGKGGTCIHDVMFDLPDNLLLCRLFYWALCGRQTFITWPSGKLETCVPDFYLFCLMLFCFVGCSAWLYVTGRLTAASPGPAATLGLVFLVLCLFQGTVFCYVGVDAGHYAFGRLLHHLAQQQNWDTVATAEALKKVHAAASVFSGKQMQPACVTVCL